MPYHGGQFWIRRFGKQVERLCAALAALCAPPASNFVCRALHTLASIGWIAAHPFLFADLRMHLLVRHQELNQPQIEAILAGGTRRFSSRGSSS